MSFLFCRLLPRGGSLTLTAAAWCRQAAMLFGSLVYQCFLDFPMFSGILVFVPGTKGQVFGIGDLDGSKPSGIF